MIAIRATAPTAMPAIAPVLRFAALEEELDEDGDAVVVVEGCPMLVLGLDWVAVPEVTRVLMAPREVESELVAVEVRRLPEAVAAPVIWLICFIRRLSSWSVVKTGKGLTEDASLEEGYAIPPSPHVPNGTISPPNWPTNPCWPGRQQKNAVNTGSSSWEYMSQLVFAHKGRFWIVVSQLVAINRH
jgi:hypothetical protein